MRAKHAWLIVGAVCASVTLWVFMIGRALSRPAMPAPPPANEIRVNGHAAERVTATRLRWELDICAPSLAAAAERVHDAVKRAQKILPPEDLAAPAPRREADQDPDARACAALTLTTANVAGAIRWHRGLVAAGLISTDDGTDPECEGDEAVAAARSRVSMKAIADARAQSDALLAGRPAPLRRGFDADVTDDQGSWDSACERVVSADANLTLPTD